MKTDSNRAVACIRFVRRWFRRQLPPKQFVVKLAPYDGQYHNFFAYGGFESVLKRARLIQRFDLGKDNCVLLFEELRDAPNDELCGGASPSASASGSQSAFTKD